MKGEKTNTDTLVSCDIDAVTQQRETDDTTTGTSDGKETQKKHEPQKDELNKPKEVEAVTNEFIIRAPKPNVGEAIPMWLHW